MLWDPFSGQSGPKLKHIYLWKKFNHLPRCSVKRPLLKPWKDLHTTDVLPNEWFQKVKSDGWCGELGRSGNESSNREQLATIIHSPFRLHTFALQSKHVHPRVNIGANFFNATNQEVARPKPNRPYCLHRPWVLVNSHGIVCYTSNPTTAVFTNAWLKWRHFWHC